MDLALDLDFLPGGLAGQVARDEDEYFTTWMDG
jgi:hypothetical protein